MKRILHFLLGNVDPALDDLPDLPAGTVDDYSGLFADRYHYPADSLGAGWFPSLEPNQLKHAAVSLFSRHLEKPRAEIGRRG